MYLEFYDYIENWKDYIFRNQRNKLKQKHENIKYYE